MRGKTVLFVFLWTVAACNAFLNEENGIEARGKKKKIALLVYFADIIIKKIFVLKLIYAFVFWLVIHKAGYFLGWFVSYLKEKKKEFHHDSPPHHHNYDYGPPEAYGPPQSYGHPQSYYDPYKRQSLN